MKIEMGESLFYSWLRHVKECQIVQTNWTTSPQWTLRHEDELIDIMTQTDELFREKYGYNIYKKNASLSQVLQQAECDVLGVSVQAGEIKIFAIDVAFHRDGLVYGDRKTTVMKIINKCLRTAMCIYGYLDAKDAEIIFASPKIGKKILEDAKPCICDIQAVTQQMGYNFAFRMIANDDFMELVLNPILLVSKGVADTNELFLRSYQMLQMFGLDQNQTRVEGQGAYAEIKIGKIAQIVLRELLESGKVNEDELLRLQDKSYCKKTFDLNFPMLVKQGDEYNKARYYVEPLFIKGNKYALCSQWVEKSRAALLSWIDTHK